MQQPCSRCGYISDRPARFCRQCGSQLFAENDTTSATTRNYAPQQTPQQFSNQQAAYAPYESVYASNRPIDEQTPETTPFYRPPMVPNYQVPVQEQKRSNWGKWLLIGFLSFLLLCAVGVGGLVYFVKNNMPRVEYRSGDAPVAGQNDPPPPADPPDPPDASAAPVSAKNLDSYKYPGAKVTESHKDGVNEVIKMSTDDDLETVSKFYQEKFKDSSVSVKNDGGEKIIYTTFGQPLITVILQPDEDHDGNIEINLVRANISIPRIRFPNISTR